MKFAKYTFLIAGIYGIATLLPQYFLEEKNSLDFPPAITHPEYYYGFIGVTLAFQVVFLLIASDPVRYRPLMLLSALLEKIPFTVAVFVLYAAGRVNQMMLGFALVDFAWAGLFLFAYFKTKPKISN